MMDSPQASPVELLRGAQQIDIFCGSAEGASVITRYLEMAVANDASTGTPTIRILFPDSVKKTFESMAAKGLPVEHFRRFRADWENLLHVAQHRTPCEIRTTSFHHESTWIVVDRKTGLTASAIKLAIPEE